MDLESGCCGSVYTCVLLIFYNIYIYRVYIYLFKHNDMSDAAQVHLRDRYLVVICERRNLPGRFSAGPILLGGFVFGRGVLLLRTANS